MNPRQILFAKLLPLFNNLVRTTPQGAAPQQIAQAAKVLSLGFNEALDEYDNDIKQQT